MVSYFNWFGPGLRLDDDNGELKSYCQMEIRSRDQGLDVALAEGRRCKIAALSHFKNLATIGQLPSVSPSCMIMSPYLKGNRSARANFLG